ncbi:MAG TPA: hypothetical protein VI072_30255 [Polyangiaceae bacterium]
MKLLRVTAAVAALALNACGGSDDDPGSTSGPPPVEPGYERIVAPLVRTSPGDDVMHCQYIVPPFERDLDIIDMKGWQSEFGHHAVAYATPNNLPVGTSGPCTGEDNVTGTFLGGVGGEAGGSIALPEGVAFRLLKGHSIMLNTHFLNVGSEPSDGESVIDIRFAEIDPSRKVASMFVNIEMGFRVPAGSPLSVTAECTFPRDMDFLMFSNHMHDYGTHASTELVRAATGSAELVREDPRWTYEMQFNSDYTLWELEDPLRIRQGDKMRTQCNWNNPTSGELKFPREMCVGIGFFLSDGTTSPVCVNGTWLERRPTAP